MAAGADAAGPGAGIRTGTAGSSPAGSPAAQQQGDHSGGGNPEDDDGNPAYGQAQFQVVQARAAGVHGQTQAGVGDGVVRVLPGGLVFPVFGMAQGGAVVHYRPQVGGLDHHFQVDDVAVLLPHFRPGFHIAAPGFGIGADLPGHGDGVHRRQGQRRRRVDVGMDGE